MTLVRGNGQLEVDGSESDILESSRPNGNDVELLDGLSIGEPGGVVCTPYGLVSYVLDACLVLR
jgi:hypothetical protein